MTSDRVCKNCDYGLYASTGCGFYPPNREKGCEHFKPKCDDKPIEKINVEFIGEEFDFVLKYMEQVGATTVQNAILNAISIALDRVE